MDRTQKEELAKSFKEKAAKAQVAIFADYKGLKASEADDLRRRLRDCNTEVKVVKNNILRKAVADGELGEDAKQLADGLVGPALIGFAYNDPAAAAKVFHEFSKDFEALQIKDSLMGQKKIGAAQIEALAKLPSKDVLLGMLLSTMNGASRGFVSVLAAVPRSFVTVLSAIEKKKTESGDS